MTAALESELPLEIAYLLFIDIVGYAKLLVNEQLELVEKLNAIVRRSPAYSDAEQAQELIRVPTGDGMALLFFRSPEEPARCALEICQALRLHPEIAVRMGVHSGPVNQVRDINDRSNVAGAGINIAQRVMDCGDAGHILVSSHLAEDLRHYRHWQPFLHDLGEYEVKHGLRIGLYNLFKDGLGNPNPPAKCKVSRVTQSPLPTASWLKKNLHPRRLAVWLIAGLLLTLLSYTAIRFLFPRIFDEKSLAVLPFQYSSDPPDYPFLADGFRGQIVIDLVKLQGLKIIAGASVLKYPTGTSYSPREIASTLGVAYLMEGRVQRLQNRLSISVNIIRGADGTIFWSDNYERELTDIFRVKTEVAKSVALAMRARLPPREAAAIKKDLATDLVAFNLYSQAKNIIDSAVLNARRREDLFNAVRLLEQAIQRDSRFAEAYYELAHAHDQLYLIDADHTSERLAQAQKAIDTLESLQPDSGELHLARAKHRYWGYLDYEGALREAITAQALLPSDPAPRVLQSYISRRQGKWSEAQVQMEQALHFDPQNIAMLQQLALTYQCLKRYRDCSLTLDRAIEAAPDNAIVRVARAALEMDWHAETKQLHATIESIQQKEPDQLHSIVDSWLVLSLYERDFAACARALQFMDSDSCQIEGIPFPPEWCFALVARAQGKSEEARTALEAARRKLQAMVNEQPNYAEALGALAVIEAGLGQKEEAFTHTQQAKDLLPPAKDSINGQLLIVYAAMTYAWTGASARAIEELRQALEIPGYLSYGDLRLNPALDSLRDEPGFQELLEREAHR